MNGRVFRIDLAHQGKIAGRNNHLETARNIHSLVLIAPESEAKVESSIILGECKSKQYVHARGVRGRKFVKFSDPLVEPGVHTNT